ncbi:MAG: aldo/keto reductase [Candidatus Microsaccharimonas sp.]
MSQVPTVKLNNNLEMPLLGFGVFQMSNEEAEESVLKAIQAGYRLIDTATSYANEEAVGRAIAKSGVPREELFITSKLWISDASEEKAKIGVQRSLEKLGLDYIDLYLIHQPFGDVFGAWRGLEAMYDEGKLKAIGISNFNNVQAVDLNYNARIKPTVNQIETHPFNQQIDTHALLAENNIVHEGWAPFAEGAHDIFNNELLGAIAAKHNKTVGQVILRWNIQRQVVAIPKSVKEDRIKENFAIFDFELSNEDMEQIATLDAGLKTVDHTDPQFLMYLYNRTR